VGLITFLFSWGYMQRNWLGHESKTLFMAHDRMGIKLFIMPIREKAMALLKIHRLY